MTSKRPIFINPSSIRSIAIISDKHVGDTVWYAWVITALKLNFPNAKLYQISHKNDSPSHTLISKELGIISLPNRICYDLDVSLKYVTSVGTTYVFPPCPLYSDDSHPPPCHILENFFNSMKEICQGFKRPDWPIMPDIAPYQSFPDGFTNRPIISIQPGTSMEDKNYPIEKWKAVAWQLVNAGYNVVFVGGPKDPRPSCTSPHILNLVGNTSLEETVAIIRASAVHLAADTGSGHIAAAYGVPVVSLFGLATYPVGCKPFGDDSIIRVLHSKDSISPNMPPESVVKAAKEIHRVNSYRIKLNRKFGQYNLIP